MNKEEVWKDVKHYECCYQVSNKGRVKSLKFGKERILKPRLNNKGYYRINLHQSGEQKTIFIHQLVAIAFLGHDINVGVLVVDHIDNDQSNNNLLNLQLITHRENSSKDKVGGTSKYTGVRLDKQRGKWIAEISIKGKRNFLGRFKCELTASIAYNNKLKTL